MYVMGALAWVDHLQWHGHVFFTRIHGLLSILVGTEGSNTRSFLTATGRIVAGRGEKRQSLLAFLGFNFLKSVSDASEKQRK